MNSITIPGCKEHKMCMIVNTNPAVLKKTEFQFISSRWHSLSYRKAKLFNCILCTYCSINSNLRCVSMPRQCKIICMDMKNLFLLSKWIWIASARNKKSLHCLCVSVVEYLKEDQTHDRKQAAI